jgi:hypothetical protein
MKKWGELLVRVTQIVKEPRYCYVGIPVELCQFFTPSKIHIFQN